MSASAALVSPVEVAVCPADVLSELSMQEFPLGEGTVLLSKVNGRIYATSHLCTHYRAPLVKGTISSDGFVKCPWHGACFRLDNGDIEDAPAIDAIESFPSRVSSDGMVLVTVSAPDKRQNTRPIGEGRRLPKCVRHMKDDNRQVLVLGGGPAGLCTAEALRQEGFTGLITVLTREPYVTIDRPQLSKSLHNEADKLQLRTKEQLHQMDIQFLVSTEATAVDTQSRTVHYHSISDENSSPTTKDNSIHYDFLVLATGASPRRPDFSGANLKNVHVLRTLPNQQLIEQAISALATNSGSASGANKPNVVMVGSSFIAMELASVLIKLVNITVVGMESVPFERVLGKEIGFLLQKVHEKNGIKFRMSTTVDHFEPHPNDSSRVGSVVLKDSKDHIPADAVIFGVGTTLNTSFLSRNSKSSNSTIPLSEKDGSILVDSYLRVIPDPSNPDDNATRSSTVLSPSAILNRVYAAGDIACIHDFFLTHKPTRIEHWTVAMNHGRQVARSIVSVSSFSSTSSTTPTPTKPYITIPYFWTAQYGKSIRYAGYSAKFDDVVVRGNLLVDSTDKNDTMGGLQFEAYYIEKDTVMAVASLGKDPLVTHCAELMRLGKMPSAKAIKGGVNPLDIPLEQDDKDNDDHKDKDKGGCIVL